MNSGPDSKERAAPATLSFLSLAAEEDREGALRTQEQAGGWAGMQQAFLRMVDEYLESELRKPVEENISAHEAGGQWRIAFPHLAVRRHEGAVRRLQELMLARKRWTDANFYHGYHKCHEVHHEIETFIFFQIPLFYWGLPGAEAALEYQPLLGGCEWGWFGNRPILRLGHQSGPRVGLPEDVAFRTWRIDADTDGFEAQNLSGEQVEWKLHGVSREQELLRIEVGAVRTAKDVDLRIEPGSSVTGRIYWSPQQHKPTSPGV